MFKKTSKWFIAMAVVTLLLGACSSGGGSDEVVATVNGKDILKKDYEVEIENTKTSYEQQGIKFDELESKQKEELEKSVLDQLINTELILQTAKEDGVSVEQDEVDSELDAIKSQFEEDKQFKEALEKNKLTEEQLGEQVKKQLIITKYIDNNVGELSATDEELQAVYNQYKESAETQEQEPEDFKTMKPQLEQQVLAQKKSKKVNELIEELRKTNEENIEILL